MTKLESTFLTNDSMTIPPPPVISLDKDDLKPEASGLGNAVPAVSVAVAVAVTATVAAAVEAVSSVSVAKVSWNDKNDGNF